MKLHSLRAAASLTAALTTAVSPLLVNAQTYEYKAYKQGLVVTGAATAPAPGPVTPPPPSPQPALQLSTSAINFGEVATNTTETRQVLVSNIGTGSLSLTAAPAVNGDAAFAAGLTTCGATLAAGAAGVGVVADERALDAIEEAILFERLDIVSGRWRKPKAQQCPLGGGQQVELEPQEPAQRGPGLARVARKALVVAFALDAAYGQRGGVHQGATSVAPCQVVGNTPVLCCRTAQ